MKTFVLRLAKPSAGGTVAAELLEWDDGSTAAIVSTTIPWPPKATAPGASPVDLTEQLAAGWPEPKLLTLGKGLFDAISHGGLRTPLHRLTRAGAADDARLLIDADPETLHHVPWETLNHNRLWLAADAAHPIARVCLSDASHTLAPCSRPIRVLIVVGFRAHDQAEAWRAEVAGIEMAVIDAGPFAEARFLVAADAPADAPLTPARIMEEMADYRPHIVHFIGHAKPAELDQDGALLILDEQWTTSAIANDLRWARRGNDGDVRPRLAFLNACESAVGAGDAWSVSRSFVEAGWPAVIATGGRIESQSAAELATEFYRRLLEPRAPLPVDAALAAARGKARLGKPMRSDLLMPMLTVRAHPETIFAHRVDARRRSLVTAIDAAQHRTDFISRCPQRRRLLDAIEASTDHDDPASVLVLKGVQEVGKSEFLKVIVRICGHEGFVPVHTSLDTAGLLGAIGLLGLLRGAIAASPLLDHARVTAAFADFDRCATELEQARRNSGHAAPLALDLAHSHNEAPMRAVVRSFAAAVAALSEAAPVVLFVDPLTGPGRGVEPGEWREHIMEHLVKPAALHGALGHGRLVLAVRPEECTELALPDRLAGVRWVELAPFSIDETAAVVKEWCLRAGGRELADDLERGLVNQLRRKNAPWLPCRLAALMEGLP